MTIKSLAEQRLLVLSLVLRITSYWLLVMIRDASIYGNWTNLYPNL